MLYLSTQQLFLKLVKLFFVWWLKDEEHVQMQLMFSPLVSKWRGPLQVHNNNIPLAAQRAIESTQNSTDFTARCHNVENKGQKNGFGQADTVPIISSQTDSHTLIPEYTWK